jgi:signal transduction histidine kinase
MTKPPPTSETVCPDHFYTIGQIVANASEWKPALAEIAQLAHKIFIFDNLAVYLTDPDTQSLEIMYARAMGRGRSKEADIAWGDAVANQTTSGRSTVIQEPSPDESEDRLTRPYLLGVPLKVNKRYLGALVLIRFGGPSFSPENIELSEFIAQQIALLIERNNLQQAYELLEAQHQLTRLQDNFISTISHELRSPLGFIKGYTTTLLRSDTTWDQTTQQEFLQIIDQETDQLMELIENLLDSSRLQSGQLQMQFQIVRLDSTLKNVIARNCMHHPELVIHLETNKNLLPVHGDPRRLGQVFENLIGNAVKYAPGSEINIGLAQEKETAHISIQDQGPGISEQYIPMLFTRFFRIPDQTRNIHGSGLGLYICKQIIEAHKGQIIATSELGKGTTFHIYLPSHT